MVIPQNLGLESYVTGPQPESVSIHANPISWVVVVYNRISKRTVAGYFEDPKESEQFRAMQLPVSDADDLNGLEVRLLCVAPYKDSVTEQTLGQQWSNERYLNAVFEGLGIQSQSVNVRYARGSKLVLVNMSTGKLRVRNLFGSRKQLEDDWHPPEPGDMYPADPPEVNERLWSRKR